jgi:acetyl-CoA synthetase
MFSALGPRPGDLFFTSLGWSTSGGMRAFAVPAWSYGYPVVCTDQPLAAEQLCQLLTRLRVTCAYLGPNILRELRQLGERISTAWDWSALRTIVYSGEAIGDQLHAWLSSRLDVDLSPYYGATETAFLTSGCGAWFHTPAGATGKPVPGRRFAILDEATHRPVSRGEIGIVCVHRDEPGLFLGYRSPDTGEVGYGGGDIVGEHFLMNDLARIDADGQLRYVGRRGQVVETVDGSLVPPTEIEDAVLALEWVEEAVAMQLEDERALTVCVTSARPHAVSDVASETIVAIAQRFGDQLTVGRVVVLAELPHTPATSKVNRRLLREGLERGTASVLADFPDLGGSKRSPRAEPI